MDEKIAVQTYPPVPSVRREPCVEDTGASLEKVSDLELARLVLKLLGSGIKERGYAQQCVMSGGALEALYRGLTGFPSNATEDAKETKGICVGSDELSSIDWARVIVVPAWDYMQHDLDYRASAYEEKQTTEDTCTADRVLKRLITKLPVSPMYVSMQYKNNTTWSCGRLTHEHQMDAVKASIERVLCSTKASSIDQKQIPGYKGQEQNGIPAWLRWPRMDVTLIDVSDDGSIVGYSTLVDEKVPSYFPYQLDQISPQDVANGFDKPECWNTTFEATNDMSKQVLVDVDSSVDYYYTSDRNPHQIAGTVMAGTVLYHSNYRMADKVGLSLPVLNRSYNVISVIRGQNVYEKLMKARELLDINDDISNEKCLLLNRPMQQAQTALRDRVNAVTEEETAGFAKFKEDSVAWRQRTFERWEESEIERKAILRRGYDIGRGEQAPMFQESPRPEPSSPMTEIQKQNRVYVDLYKEQTEIEFSRRVYISSKSEDDVDATIATATSTPVQDIPLAARLYPRFGNTYFVTLKQ